MFRRKQQPRDHVWYVILENVVTHERVATCLHNQRPANLKRAEGKRLWSAEFMNWVYGKETPSLKVMEYGHRHRDEPSELHEGAYENA
jgi:hypothetical protein